MTKKDVKPYYAIKHDYFRSLDAYCLAAEMLSNMVGTLIDLADKPGVDLKRGVEMLREYNEQFRKAMHVPEKESEHGK